MIICKECRCFHPVTVSDRYCGECCIGDTRNPIAINADITGCCLFEPKQPKPKLSNADRIRQMTDEELAESLSGSVACTHVTGCLDTSCYECSCYECTLAWLKQEVKKDAKSDHEES